MTRRRFAFWLGLSLFWLAEKAGIPIFDQLAAVTMRSFEATEDSWQSTPKSPGDPGEIRWKAAENSHWQWYERETWLRGKWTLSGITTPIHKVTGQPYLGKDGYLDESLVPVAITGSHSAMKSELHRKPDSHSKVKIPSGQTQPDPARRARHGRPPSQWLRSLRADEIRVWLKTIDVPEAGVSGMTYWDHLVEDHFFNPKKIVGLSIDEQAKLHGAAHFGY